jgi:hypothetical protein
MSAIFETLKKALPKSNSIAGGVAAPDGRKSSWFSARKQRTIPTIHASE